MDGVEMVLSGEGEECGLGGRNAIESPGGVPERLDKLLLERAFGLELVDETLEMVLVGGLVFGGQDDDVSGEAMAQSVQRLALLAACSTRPGGILTVRLLTTSTVR